MPNPADAAFPAAGPPGGGSPSQPAPSGFGAMSPGPSGTGPNGADDGLAGALASGLGGGLSGGNSYFGMLGDQSPIVGIRQGSTIPPLPQPIPPNGAPSPPNPRLASSLAPSVRGIKIAENQSPRPQDRVFYSFNYYSDVNGALNARLDAPVRNLRVYRHILGLEKTFFDGQASFGVRLPIDTLTADSNIPGKFAKQGGTSTSAGDMGLFAKFIFRENRETGSLISAGVALTAPSGPANFAGAKYVQSLHTTRVQPFVGYIYNINRFYLHGFSAVEFPMNPADVTLAYNDAGVGYFLMRSPDPGRWLTAIAPTFEVHVNTPLNHRGAFNTRDLSGTANVVNLTYGVNFEFARRSILTLGLVTPVTSPRPFDLEAVVLFNVRFGPRSRPRIAPPPVIGG